MWHARFKNGDQEFLAIGENRDLMEVYRLESGRVVRTRTSFPNCLKFMPYAEIDEETAGQKTPEWIEETYGPTDVVDQNDP